MDMKLAAALHGCRGECCRPEAWPGCLHQGKCGHHIEAGLAELEAYGNAGPAAA